MTVNPPDSKMRGHASAADADAEAVGAAEATGTAAADPVWLAAVAREAHAVAIMATRPDMHRRRNRNEFIGVLSEARDHHGMTAMCGTDPYELPS